MNCPICDNQELEKMIFYNTEVDFCSRCLGIWFEQDELRQAKDSKLPDLNWLDIDLWQDKLKFKISKTEKMCPKCDMPMYMVNYNDSVIQVDICNLCKGVWLDRGEFKKIADYLREKGDKQENERYIQNLIKQGVEIFTGPETLREEINDFLAVLKLLDYKFASKHKTISDLILSLPK